MSLLHVWLEHFPQHRVAPLFDVDGELNVQTLLVGKRKDRRVLKRSPEFDAAMIEMVEAGVTDEDWHGFIYIMGVGCGAQFTPLYVGKAEKRGTTNAVSANLKGIRRNHGFFGRWGYNRYYHVGDLSHAVLGVEAGGEPKKKYRRWAEALFETVDPPRLREPVFVYLAPWFSCSRGPSGLLGSVPAAEKEVIALASAVPGDRLLNTDGR